MENSKRWLAIYTRPRCERKTAESLTRKGIETFCPLNRQVRQWTDRKKVVTEPLFTSYVFVRIDSKETAAVLQTSGALNFVYWLNKPAVIRDEEIDAIKDFLLLHTNVKVEKMNINVHDKVTVISGPLRSREGEVMEVKNRTVRICLPSLGYMLMAEVNKVNVQVVPLMAGDHFRYENRAI